MIKLPKQPEVTNPEYSMFDDGGVECEVGEFLFGLVKILKPHHILETGLYSGISAMYMALALKENKKGHLDTIEYESQHIERSKKRFIQHGVNGFITTHHVSSLDFQPKVKYDLMFLDTELSLRMKELERFYDYLIPGGYVFVHDFPINLCQGNVNPDHPGFKHWPIGEIPEKIKLWVKSDKLRPMFLPNPRGMLGFYKPQEGEYKWE